MLFRLSATIVSPYRRADLTPLVIAGGITCGTQKDPKGRGWLLYAQVAVPDYQSLLPTISREVDSLPALDIPSNPYWSRLLGILQYVEALGGIVLGIDVVDWESANGEWIPETEEERSALQVSSFRRREEIFPPPPPVFPHATLRSLLAHHDRLEGLTTLFSVLHQGRQAYRHLRYLEAFFFCYLFIEGGFARGKTANPQVIRELGRSPAVQSATESFLALLRHPPSDRHAPILDGLLSQYACDRTPEGIITLLVMSRGAMFHLSRPASYKGLDPQRRRELHTLAFMALSLGVYCGISLVSRDRQTGVDSQPRR